MLLWEGFDCFVCQVYTVMLTKMYAISMYSCDLCIFGGSREPQQTFVWNLRHSNVVVSFYFVKRML